MITEVEKFRSFTVRRFRRDDNDKILKLLRETPMSSSLPLIIDRSPNYFSLEDKLKGFNPCHVVAELEETQEIVGVFHCYERDQRVEEDKVAKFIYIGDLRVDKRFRRKGIAKQMMGFIGKMTKNSDLYGGYTFVNQGNNKTLELIKNEFQRQSFHCEYVDLGYFHTKPIYFFKKPKQLKNEKWSYEEAQESDLKEIISLFNQTWKDYFLAPPLNVNSLNELLNSELGLKVNRVRLVRDQKTKKILAFTLIWDQSQFKSLKIAKYPFYLGVFRRIINLISFFYGSFSMPRAGEPLKYFESTFFTVKNQKTDLAYYFINCIYNEFYKEKYHFFNLVLLKNSYLKKLANKYMGDAIKTKIIYLHSKKYKGDLNKIRNKQVYMDVSFI